jgi:hypothetical protein
MARGIEIYTVMSTSIFSIRNHEEPPFYVFTIYIYIYKRYGLEN